MKDIYISNTLSKKKEKLKTIENGLVKIYCCGPTVYNFAHIGNLRTYIFEDILVKTLKIASFKVKHVMNITDVGHLTSDADSGDDKMLVAAEREKKTVFDIARKYEDCFFKDTNNLHLNRPDIICRASEHIQEMIDFIKILEEKGFAYKGNNGNIYFDTVKFDKYGELSGQNRNDLKFGARVEEDENKKNPTDFVLWFVLSKFKNQILKWDSPWGVGYPGWHIECSVMSTKYLGDNFDIHCGGIDHIPVHHENEIAQNDCCIGHKVVNNWLHVDFLQIKDGKMSKSTGNFITLNTLIEKGYKPEHYKYFTLTAHYKTPLIFSYENLDNAKNTYDNLIKKINSWKENKNNIQDNFNKLNQYIDNFNNCLFDDFNTPQALSILWEVVKSDLSNNDKLNFIYHIEKVFNLNLLENNIDVKIDIPQEIIDLAEQRKQAKIDKNWSLSDDLRNKINEKGYIIEDTNNNNYILKTK